MRFFKFISKSMKMLISFLALSSIIFYSIGFWLLSKSDYNISDYANDFSIDNDFIKSTLNINHNYFNFEFGFNFNNYSTINDYSLNNIDELIFNLTSQYVEVSNYSGDTLNIKIESNDPDNVELTMNKVGSKLVLSTKYNTPNDAGITINVPNSFVNKTLIKLTTSSGDIDVSDLTCKSLALSTGNGNLKASNCNISYLNVNSSSGNISLNNVFSYLESKIASNSGKINASGYLGLLSTSTVSGKITLNLSSLNDDIFIASNSGNINLTLPQFSDYKLDYETTLGSFNSSPSLLSSGDQSININVKTVSGDLSLN